MTPSRLLRSFRLQVIVLILCLAGSLEAKANSATAEDGQQPTGQTQNPPVPASAPPTASPPDPPVPAPQADITPTPPANAQQSAPAPESEKDKAAEQVKQEEHQRILGVVPNFNTSYIQDAAPLSRQEKFGLAFKSSIDFGTILVAAADAAYNEWTDSFPEYGQGMKGYAKYLGASYADTFDGTMLGNALFPILLKQDPRFYRKGTGSFTSRLLYAIGTTFWCKDDDGKRVRTTPMCWVTSPPGEFPTFTIRQRTGVWG